jgi:hypothetical protein
MNALIVSNALDTNGQNYRYAQAAERWGSDANVLKALVAGEYDPADVGGRYREAARKHGGLSIRTAHVAEAYFEFPRDIRWTRGTNGEVQQLADECDVIHLNNSDMAYRKLRMPKQRKPALLHHHGTLFRNRPEPLLASAKRFHMIQAVSTIDLQRKAPDLLHWLPTAYDLDAMAKIRAEYCRPEDGLVRIVSAPTNREIKSTAALEIAVSLLQSEGLPVELVLIEGKPWAECLRLKATADIYFDQVGLGYGCNAIEAWGMGIPVIAGADEWTLARMRKEWNTRTLPFHVATEATIAAAIRQLVKSPDLRATVAARGAKHAAKYHAEKPALSRLAELYGMAIAKQRSAVAAGESFDEFPMASGVFRTDRPRLMVRLGNQEIRFTDGEVRIDNPQVAQKMRRMARFQQRYQISEVLVDAR